MIYKLKYSDATAPNWNLVPSCKCGKSSMQFREDSFDEHVSMIIGGILNMCAFIYRFDYTKTQVQWPSCQYDESPIYLSRDS